MSLPVRQEEGLAGLHLSDSDFRRLSERIHACIGVCLTSEKKILLEGRLMKRMRRLNLTSYSEYCRRLFSPQGLQEEFPFLIDAVTTNKTDFFREPVHFDFLVSRVLPELCPSGGVHRPDPFLVWSSACSTGEEPYTLAMVLQEVVDQRPDLDYSILATDISRTVLEKAELAVYDKKTIEPIPLPLRQKYLLKSKDPLKSLVRITPELRKKVVFQQVNLMADPLEVPQGIDLIFCRNVMIYFDRPTQEKLVNRFFEHLTPGGYLFIGHAESLGNIKTPFRYVAPTIYQKGATR